VGGRCALGGGGGGNRSDDLDRLGNAQARGCESWERGEKPRLGVWVAEEAGPVVRIRAGEGEPCQVGDVDAEGRGKCEATTTGWGAECIGGAAAAADAEPGLVCAAAAEDQVITRRLAEYEVGCFEVEL
jgi:hypothetical protein